MNLREPRMKRPSFVNLTRRGITAAFLALTFAVSLTLDLPALAAAANPAAKNKKPKQSAVLKGLPISELSEDEAILHALNRWAFGPRPGDIEHVR